MQTDVWRYRDETWAGADIAGFEVEALDGSIGKVDRASNDVGAGSIVVDTGPWIFGKKVMLPAGVVDRIDVAEEKVYVHRTKDQIKNAPEYDDSLYADDRYRGELGTYYGSGPGFRGWNDTI